MKRATNQRGSVLIAVIWILSFLAIFTLAVHRRASAELFAGAWIRDRVVARSIAKAGIERAVFEIQQDEFLTFDVLNDGWASNEVAFKDLELGDGFLIVSCDPRSLGLDKNTKEKKPSDPILYGACDESGKLNVNYANEAQLKNLILLVNEDFGESEAFRIAHAIIDWRDEDNAVMAFGAEENYYKATFGSALPRNTSLETLEELKMIRGIDEELYELLSPHITVYGSGLINFNTASSLVLQAVGLSEELAQKLMEFRAGEDTIPGTEDDAAFQIVEGITPALSASVSFSPDEFAQIANLISQEFVTVGSDAFRIQSIGRLIKNRRLFSYVITSIVTRTGEFLYWKEDSYLADEDEGT